MLPHDQKPWAVTLAKTVVVLAAVGLICLGIFLARRGSLHISEIVGIVLLFLAIVPPNLAIIYKKSDPQNLSIDAGRRQDQTSFDPLKNALKSGSMRAPQPTSPDSLPLH